jgi:hypothetical protein
MDGRGRIDGGFGDGQVGELELQRSSGEFLERVNAMRELEMEKRALPAADPRRPELASRIEGMALDLMGRSQYQTRLTEAQAERIPAPVRPLHVVLTDWREAERRLKDAHEAVWRTAGESRRFGEEYQRNLELGHSEPERGAAE